MESKAQLHMMSGNGGRRLAMPYFGIALALFSLGLGSAAQRVTTSFQHDFDFGSQRRYAWRPNHIFTRQGHQNDAIIDQTIVQSVNHTLTAKGFSEDRTSPDFFISCDAGAASKADVEALPPPPGAITPPNPSPGIRQNIWYSVDGAITFRLTDAKSNRVVWTAVATKKIRDPQKAMKNLDQQVQQFVSKAFQSFPPRPK